MMVLTATMITGLYFFIFRVANLQTKFAEARNVSRSIQIQNLSDALYTYISSTGKSPESIGAIVPCEKGRTKIGTSKSDTEGEWIDLTAVLSVSYLSEIPEDPQNGSEQDTGYTICMLAGNRLQIEATHTELGKKISLKR
jgi:hypothetical protein